MTPFSSGIVAKPTATVKRPHKTSDAAMLNLRCALQSLKRVITLPVIWPPDVKLRGREILFTDLLSQARPHFAYMQHVQPSATFVRAECSGCRTDRRY